MKKLLVIATTVCSILVCVAIAVGAVFVLVKHHTPKLCENGHTFVSVEVLKKPTCGVAGSERCKCSVCGTEQEQEIPATGEHRLSGWTTEVGATLTEPGLSVRYCERCSLPVDSTSISPIGQTIAVNASAGKVNFTVTGYTLVYDEKVAHPLFLSTVQRFLAAVEKTTGAALECKPANAVTAEEGTMEILVGSVDRPQTKAALAKIQGSGFIVEILENKVVIVGTDALQTICALQHLTLQYFGAPDTNALFLPQVLQADNAKQLVLANSKTGSEFDLIFGQYLDNDPHHPYVSSATSDTRDYPCVAAQAMAADLATLTGLQATDFGVRNSKDFGVYEVLIGSMERVETKFFMSMLDGNEYGILVKNGQVLLLAWNDYALSECLAQFMELLAYARTENGEASEWCLPEGFYAIGVANDNWRVDFPRPTGEGITMSAAQSANDDSLQFLYTGVGVNAAAFNAYCNTLIAQGYVVLTENEIEGSLFKTLYHTAKGLSLYVAYNDYAHKSTYERDDSFNVDYQKCIRVISAPLSSVSLPTAELLNPNQSYTRITDTHITVMPLNGHAVGMGYIIMLEDGSFVGIDGGTLNDSTYRTESHNLWNTMVALYKQAHDGNEPTATSPIHIRAWFVTHSHGDHYNAFRYMLKAYGHSGLVKMDYLIGNFPEWSAMYVVSSGSTWMGKPANIAATQADIAGGFTYVKVYTGQKIYLANLEMEVLMTYQDHLPRRIDNSNDSCTVTRVTLHNTQTPSATVTATFLADAFRFQSRYLCAMYGDYLKSDIVQLAHHGNIGCEQAVYDAISPTVVLFPNDTKSFLNYTAGTSKTWNFKVDHYVVHQLASVKYVYAAVAGSFFTIRLGNNGLDYAGIYDVIKGTPIAYNQSTIIQKDAPAA